MGISIPEYQDCSWCHKKDACRFSGYGYVQPCNACRNTEKFEKYMKEKQKEKDDLGGIDNALKAGRPAAVWEGRGRQVVTNHKGDIISNVPYKPRQLGRKGTSRELL